jgi:hypothetical protein
MHISGSSSSSDGIHYIADNTRGAGGPAGIVMKSTHGDWKMINSQTVADALEFIDGSAGVTRMLIDSSGNVGIGTSSPQRSLSIGTHGSSPSAEIAFGTTTTGYASLLFGDGTTGTSLYDGYIQYEQSGSNMLFATGGGSERMRIDSSGNLIFGKTTTAVTTAGVTLSQVARFNVATNGGEPFYFYYAVTGANVGSITHGTTSTSFNTTSDYRLKENVTDVTDGIARVKQLAPRRFNFIAEPDITVDGFIAHEAQAVVPEAVTKAQDAMRDEEYEVTPAVLDEDGNEVTPAVMGTRSVPDYQGIDQSKLVPLLTAALQEAITKIEQLEARVATLEG